MSKKKRRKQTQTIQTVIPPPESKTQPPPSKKFNLLSAIIGVIVGALITGGISLYINRAEVEPRNVFIECAICDDLSLIYPPDASSANTGANIKLVLENTGNNGTTLLNHNMSIRAQDPAQLLKDLDFSETPDANDNIALGLGAHSQVTMALTRNEAVIYSARHGVPRGSSIAKIERDKLYLFGHVIYRSFLHFPATTHFCF